MSETLYVIKTADGKFIAVDTESGGYPYEVDRLRYAAIWTESEFAKLQDYFNTFSKRSKHGWEIHHLYYKTEKAGIG